MEKNDSLRKNMVRSVKLVANSVSLEELNLIVTDTVLNWTMEDFFLSMSYDYNSCIELSRKLQDGHLSSSERSYFENVKSLYTGNLSQSYQTYHFFSRLNDMRGNVFEVPDGFDQNVYHLLRQENYSVPSPQNKENGAVFQKGT